MAEGNFTIGIPGAGATALATSPLRAVVLDDWGSAGIPVRSPVGFTALTGRSTWGTAQITGAAHRVLWSWEVSAYLGLADALALGALMMWQDTQQKLQQPAPLRLIDETDYAEALPSPHPSTLLSAITLPGSAGWVYGYGVYPVKLVMPGGWRQPAGLFSDGEQARQVTFQVEEQ